MPSRRNNDTLDPTRLDQETSETTGRPNPKRRYATPAIELGRGGLGRVVRVHDRHLDRSVARKELLPSATTAGPRALIRFQREALITARLEHPNILPIYEYGVGDDGSPWYTTRVIRGPTLATALEEAKTPADRLKLLPSIVAAAQALAYAHGERVVHRDVTPRNIMVGPFGETVLIDWGLAKVLDAPEDEPAGAPSPGGSTLTAAGTPHGTIAYASPEQLLGELDRIDARTDIWGLGATLYHLLTGRPPRNGPQTRGPPSADPIQPVRDLAPGAPVELVSIVERALQTEPERRYPTMSAMLADLLAFQGGRPVLAHPYGAWDHLQRLVRARPREAVIAGVGALGLLLSSLGTGATWVTKDAREQEATTGKAIAEALLAGGEGRHARALRAGVQALAVHEDADLRGTVLAAGRRWIPQTTGRWTIEGCPRGYPSPDGQRVACAEGAVLSVHTLGHPRDTAQTWTLADRVTATAWSPTGDVLAAALEDGRLFLLSGAEPTLIGSVGPEQPYTLAWLSKDRLALGSIDGEVHLLGGGPPTILPRGRSGVVVQSVATAGDVLLIGSASGAEAWAVSTGTLLWRRDGPGLALLTAAPGQPFLSGTSSAADGQPFVHSLSLSTGEELATAELPFASQQLPVATPDGLTILIPSETGLVTALAMPGLDVRAAVDLDHRTRPRIAVGPHGIGSDSALVVQDDGVVERWELPSPWPPRIVHVAPGLIYTPAVSPSGKRILTPTTVGLLRGWSWPSLAPEQTWTLPNLSLETTVWLDDEHAITTGSHGQTFDIGPAGATEGLRLFDGAAYGLAAIGEDGLIAGGEGGHLGRWSRTTKISGWQRELDSLVVGLTSVLAQQSVVVPTMRAGIYRVNAGDGHDEERVSEPGTVYCARPAASPDGQSAAFGGHHDLAPFLERRAAAALTSLTWRTPVEARPAAIAWSPDGAWVAAGLLDGHILILNAADGSIRARIRAHSGQIWGISFLEGGQALATTGSDGTLRIWDVADIDTPAERLVAALADGSVAGTP